MEQSKGLPEVIYLQNERNLFVFVLIIGLLLNFFVYSANGYIMPVKTGFELESKTHIGYINNEDVKLWFLSDIIRIPFPNWLIVISIGDIIIILSIIMMLFYQVKVLIYLWHTKR